LIHDDPQIVAITRLRSEIEGIARAATIGAPQNPGAVSFSPALLSDSRQSFTTLLATVQSLLAKLKPTALVQTTADPETIQTVIRYGTGTHSVSTPNLSLQLAQIHLRSLERTFALRSAVAGAIAAAAGTLMTLSASVVNPLTILHTLSMAKALQEALERLSGAVEAAA